MIGKTHTCTGTARGCHGNMFLIKLWYLIKEGHLLGVCLHNHLKTQNTSHTISQIKIKIWQCQDLTSPVTWIELKMTAAVSCLTNSMMSYKLNDVLQTQGTESTVPMSSGVFTNSRNLIGFGLLFAHHYVIFWGYSYTYEMAHSYLSHCDWRLTHLS